MRGLQALLRSLRLIAAREVAQLQLLAQPEYVGVQARGAARTDGQLVHVEVQGVAALVVNGLQRLLHVEQEAGEVFDAGACRA